MDGTAPIDSPSIAATRAKRVWMCCLTQSQCRSATGFATPSKSAAATYDRARPNYPPELFDELIHLAGIGPNASLRELGSGTGKATVPLAERGYRVGQPMDASGFGTLASHFPDRTVVTYDPRGIGRSTRKDGRVDSVPTVQAQDVHAIIGALSVGPVEMFASSRRRRDCAGAGGRLSRRRDHLGRT